MTPPSSENPARVAPSPSLVTFCRFLATGEDTSGKYALFEAVVSPGGEPLPHACRLKVLDQSS